MNDVAALFLVVAAVYFWECLYWVPLTAIAFRRTFGNGWLPAGNGWVLGSQRSRVLFPFPFLPRNSIVVCDDWPIRASAEGFWTCGDSEVIPYDATHRVTSDEKKVLLNGKLLAGTASKIYARHLAGWLNGLQSLTVEERYKSIQKEMRRALNAEAAKERTDDFNDASSWLKVFSDVLFFFVFVLCPIMIYISGLHAIWPNLLMELVLLAIVTAVLFARTYRQILPAGADRGTGVVTALLSPPSAMRSADIIERDLLSVFHPVAAAIALLEGEVLKTYAVGTVSRMRFPVQPPRFKEEEWFEEAWLKEVESLISRRVADVAQLLAPPPRGEPTSRTYCPRCRVQFQLPDGKCPDCPGIELRLLA